MKTSYVNLAKVNVVRIETYNSLVGKPPFKYEEGEAKAMEVTAKLKALNIEGLDCYNKANEIVQDAVWMIHGTSPAGRVNHPVPLSQIADVVEFSRY